jgi:hypothetical protein
MLRTLLTTIIGLSALSLALPASAQSICGARDDFVQHLAQRHKEAPAAMGLSSNGKMVEVLTNDETGTWTIIVTNADGSACVIAAGEAWQQILPQMAMKPAA